MKKIDSSSGWLSTSLSGAIFVALLGITACVLATGVIIVVALGLKITPGRPRHRG